MKRFFRLGSPSYVYPDDILPNVRILAPYVDDIELIFFEVDDRNNLPAPVELEELQELARSHDLTYTVHLPLDLELGSKDVSKRRQSLDTANRVIEHTGCLSPWAFVVHLNQGEKEAHRSELQSWQENAMASVEELGKTAGGWELLAVENLESYDPCLLTPIREALPISLCVDIGHFLKQGSDPMPFLLTNWPQTRVIHLHGVNRGRDHQSVQYVPEKICTSLFELFKSQKYRGVLTLEVFSEEKFFSSREHVWSFFKDQD